jgi:predicted flap endonuclease-1-like 5' DNA nuclease
MRSDIVLYIVAAFFFALTISAAVIITQEERSLWIVSTAVLGFLSVGLGYYQRPQANVRTQTSAQTKILSQTEEVSVVEAANPTVEAPQVTEVTIQQPTIEQTPSIIETQSAPIITQEITQTPQPTESPLTKVKGIGEKRATQLNAIGISTVEELAKSSVDEVAKNLKVSPKIVAKWVEAAKQA